MIKLRNLDRARPVTDGLAVLADAYREALANARLDGGHQRVEWIWETDDPRQALWLPAHAGIELLRSTHGLSGSISATTAAGCS